MANDKHYFTEDENKVGDSVQFLNRQEFLPLLQQLANAHDVAIRIKRIDRLNHGNFSTVIRASGGFIMVREIASGIAEVIPDLRDVQYFELDKDFSGCKANTIYSVVSL
jgi:hypothetical protein